MAVRGSGFEVRGTRESRGHVTGKPPLKGGKLREVATPSTCPRNSRNFSFKVVSEPDNGIYDGMNKGLRLATGDVVGILNADDFYFGPDVLAHVANVFESKQVESCYGDLVYVTGQKSLQSSVCSHQFESQGTSSQGLGDSCQSSVVSLQSTKDSWQSSVVSHQFESQGTASRGFRVVRYWRSGEFDARKFYWGWMPPHPTFFVRRSVYERYGYFNPEMGTAADYELMLRFLVKHGVSSEYLPEIIVKMRSGGASNVTLGSRLRANRMDRKAWEVNGLKPYPWTLMMKPLRKVGQWFSRPRP